MNNSFVIFGQPDEDAFEFPAILLRHVIVFGLDHAIHWEHGLIPEQCQQFPNTSYILLLLGMKINILIGEIDRTWCTWDKMLPVSKERHE